MGTRTRQARGPREKPHGGADQARWWGWRRTRSEPTRLALIGSTAWPIDVRPAMMLQGVSVKLRGRQTHRHALDESLIYLAEDISLTI